MRILLLCTVFPPNNATGGRRPYYMARKLVNEGHRVTVVTGQSTTPGIWHVDLGGIEVIRLEMTDRPSGLPWTTRWIAWLHKKSTGRPFHGPVRVLADLVLPLDHRHCWRATPAELVARMDRQDMVIATGPSWSTFEYGHYLAQHWGASYFVDYRDPWSMAIPEVGLHTITYLGGPLSGKLRRWRMRHAERRCTSKATGITAASSLVLQNALRVIGTKPSQVTINGFDPTSRNRARERNAVFTMVYTGTVYREQEWNLVMQGIELFAQLQPGLLNQFKLIIAGARTEADQFLQPLARWMAATPQVEALERIDHKASIGLQSRADLLLHVGFKDKRGLYPLKFIEYLAAGPPIVQVSTSKDLIEAVLEHTRAGHVVNSADAFARLIAEHGMAWKAGHPVQCDPDTAAMQTYSWEHQAKQWHHFIMDHHAQAARSGHRALPAG